VLDDVAAMHEHLLEAPHIPQAEDPLQVIRLLGFLTDDIEHRVDDLEGLAHNLDEADVFDSV